MRRQIVQTRGTDPRRQQRPEPPPDALILPSLRATPAEHALHKQMCRAERLRVRGGLAEPE
jgi:hypothetical protein